jgi:hypothetical protein
MNRSAADGETTSDVHDACAEDLKQAAEAVATNGQTIKVLRAWIQVSGGGSYGLAPSFYPATEDGTVDVVARLKPR